jgi:hypothetical protein
MADKFSWAHVDFFLSATMCFSGFDACEFFMMLGIRALYILALREQVHFHWFSFLHASIYLQVVKD